MAASEALSRRPKSSWPCPAVLNRTDFSPFELYRSLAERNCTSSAAFFDFCTQDCKRYLKTYHLHILRDVESLIYGKIFPCLVCLAILANVMVVLVLSRRQMRSPTNVILLYMAIAEMFVGIVPLPWTLFFWSFGNYRNEQEVSLFWCYMHKFLTDSIPPICHNSANWLTAILAIQRFLSVQFPMRSRKWVTVRNVKRCALLVVVLSALNGLQKFVDHYIYLEHSAVLAVGRLRDALRDNRSSAESLVWDRRACVGDPTPLVQLVGQSAYYNVYYWTRSLLFITIPCLLLVIFNTLLIRGIGHAHRRKKRLLREQRDREARRQGENTMMSLMLVLIVSIFLVVNLPQAIFIAVFTLNITFRLNMAVMRDRQFTTVFLLVSNMLVIGQYPVNFAIYCSMSSQFRQTFQQLFCRARRRDGPAGTEVATFAFTRAVSRRGAEEDDSVLEGNSARLSDRLSQDSSRANFLSLRRRRQQRYNGERRLPASRRAPLAEWHTELYRHNSAVDRTLHFVEPPTHTLFKKKVSTHSAVVAGRSSTPSPSAKSLVSVSLMPAAENVDIDESIHL